MHIYSNDRAFDILLVEDNPSEARLVQLAIVENKAACTVNLARHGEEALDYLRNEHDFKNPDPPDLILLDLNLPGKSGVEVLSEIKADELLRQIPVIIFSSSRSEKDITACYRLHANAYIIKPETFEDYVEIMKGLINFWNNLVQLPAKDMLIYRSVTPVATQDDFLSTFTLEEDSPQPNTIPLLK